MHWERGREGKADHSFRRRTEDGRKEGRERVALSRITDNDGEMVTYCNSDLRCDRDPEKSAFHSSLVISPGNNL